MKRAFAYILFLVVFLDYTSLSQMLKLPVLFVHFLEHREIDEQINFIQYLTMHYGGDDKNDGDEQRDMELPYKTFHGNYLTNIATPAVKLFAHKPLLVLTDNTPSMHGQENLPQRSTDNPFRPPRI